MTETPEDYIGLATQAYATRLHAVLEDYKRRGLDGPTVLGPPEALAERGVNAALAAVCRPGENKGADDRRRIDRAAERLTAEADDVLSYQVQIEPEGGAF